MKTESTKGRWLPALALYMICAIMLSWRIWMPGFNAATGGAALKTTLILEAGALLSFGIMLLLPWDILGKLRRFLRKHSLMHPAATSIFFLTLITVGGLLSKVLQDSVFIPERLSCCIILVPALVYSMVKDDATFEELDRYWLLYTLTSALLITLSVLIFASPALGTLLSLILASHNFKALFEIPDEQLTKNFMCKSLVFIAIMFISVILYFFADYTNGLFRLIHPGDTLLVYKEAATEAFLNSFRAAGLWGYIIMALFPLLLTAFSIIMLVKSLRIHMTQLHCGAISLLFSVSFAMTVRSGFAICFGRYIPYHIVPFMGFGSILLLALTANSIFRHKKGLAHIVDENQVIPE